MSPPNETHDFWFESAGVRLFAVARGTGDAIVVLHGGMASHVAVAPLVAHLPERCRVIAPDVRGSGRSWYRQPLSFDMLVGDLRTLLDHEGIERAIICGVSTGSGIALAFALRHPERLAALVVVSPVYAGAEIGYTEEQRERFGEMDAAARRAMTEGMTALEPLYARLPDHIRTRALAMLRDFDVESLTMSSGFVASGAQPFDSPMDLQGISTPTLVVRGDDAIHPAQLADLYAANLRNCIVLTGVSDVGGAIGEFVTSLPSSSRRV